MSTVEQENTVDSRPVMVNVDHVSMVFNMASEQLNNLKEYFIKLMKHELFFKEFVALNNISFTVRKGDVYGIVGTNGSGKSTMLKIVAGVLEPSKGSCEINGNIAPLIELGAGFDLELTARENIYLNGSLLGYSKEYIADHFDEIVEFAELRDFLDLPMKNYSSGMVARIAFAIATIMIPDILIVDEALSVGDVFFQEKCERRINSLIKDHNTTVLFVSHSIDQVERICQRAIWIEKGHKVMEGEVHSVCAAYRSMGYIEYVCTNQIMKRAIGDSFDIQESVSIEETKSAFSNIGFDITSYLADRSDTEKGTLSRQTAALLFYRLIEQRRPDLIENSEARMGAFVDVENVDEKARVAVEWGVSSELLKGVIGNDGENLIAPTHAVSRVGLAQMFATLYQKILSYPEDVCPTSPYVISGYFDYGITNGLVLLYESGLFTPYGNATRSHVASLLWKAVGCPKASKHYDYSDIPFGHTDAKAISWATENKLFPVLSKGSFSPEAFVTRKDYADIVAALYASRNESMPQTVLGGIDDQLDEPLNRAEALVTCVNIARNIQQVAR